MYEKINIPEPFASQVLLKAIVLGISADELVERALRKMLGKEDDKPEKNLIVVMTDGGENSSKE